jgi:hypothetical protein
MIPQGAPVLPMLTQSGPKKTVRNRQVEIVKLILEKKEEKRGAHLHSFKPVKEREGASAKDMAKNNLPVRPELVEGYS